jgi:ribokinase
LIASLLDGGWVSGVADEELVRAAAERAAAAAALVLDRAEFGFPGESEINEALRAGVVR